MRIASNDVADKCGLRMAGWCGGASEFRLGDCDEAQQKLREEKKNYRTRNL